MVENIDDHGFVPPVSEDSPNQAYIANLSTGLALIKDTFPDIVDREPLSLEDGGFLTPYDANTFDLASGQHGEALSYTCAIGHVER